MNNKYRILIVDDELSNITVLRLALESDYSIQISKSGEQAIQIARKAIPDLILLDIIMPKMDGLAVCSQLQAMAETRHIPIIFITSKVESESETHGLQSGAVDYITKPFNTAVVKARVRTQLELKKYRDHLEEMVKLRTNQLETKSKELAEVNIALRILLKQKDKMLTEVEENLMIKMRDLIMPFVTRMKTDQRPSARKTYINLIESNLRKLIEPFNIEIDPKFQDLSPTEVQIVNMVREGKTTKEIAGLLNLAIGTITWYRDNIREKMGLKNKKVGLKAHLMAMQK